MLLHLGQDKLRRYIMEDSEEPGKSQAKHNARVEDVISITCDASTQP
jgi:hypothetical protein